MNISEARRLLPSIIHDLEQHPDHVFRISVRDRFVAELKGTPQVSKKGTAAKAMLDLVKQMKKKKKGVSRVSENVDKYIYKR